MHHFVLEAKVKWVNAGMRMMEGWVRKVLRMPGCQQETRPRSNPGRKMVAKIATMTSTSGTPQLNGEASASPFPTRERRQAAKISRNLGQTEGTNIRNELKAKP